MGMGQLRQHPELTFYLDLIGHPRGVPNSLSAGGTHTRSSLGVVEVFRRSPVDIRRCEMLPSLHSIFKSRAMDLRLREIFSSKPKSRDNESRWRRSKSSTISICPRTTFIRICKRFRPFITIICTTRLPCVSVKKNRAVGCLIDHRLLPSIKSNSCTT